MVLPARCVQALGLTPNIADRGTPANNLWFGRLGPTSNPHPPCMVLNRYGEAISMMRTADITTNVLNCEARSREKRHCSGMGARVGGSFSARALEAFLLPPDSCLRHSTLRPAPHPAQG